VVIVKDSEDLEYNLLSRRYVNDSNGRIQFVCGLKIIFTTLSANNPNLIFLSEFEQVSLTGHYTFY
jgi:hypothetical protein